MLELKALLLTQGMHGMVSQVEGLAKALGLSYKHQKIELKSFWNLIPPKISPISENLVKNKFVCDCKIIISCGRKSVIPSIALKKRLGNQIFNIHIQDPKVSFEHFDLIVSPEHDRLKGENIINTTGAIHYLTKKEINDNSKYLGIEKDKRKELVAFIIGGPNKYYNYSEKQIHELFNKVKTLFTPDKFKIIVIPSYRTPENILKIAYNTFSVNHHVVKNIDKVFLNEIYAIFQSFSDRTPGTFTEKKESGLVWHFRKTDPELASERVVEMETVLNSLLTDQFQILNLDKAIEVTSRKFDKGSAVNELTKKKKYDHIVCIGDDITDENMFKNLNENCTTIKVGIKNTIARFYIDDPESVINLLNDINNYLK